MYLWGIASCVPGSLADRFQALQVYGFLGFEVSVYGFGNTFIQKPETAR